MTSAQLAPAVNHALDVELTSSGRKRHAVRYLLLCCLLATRADLSHGRSAVRLTERITIHWLALHMHFATAACALGFNYASATQTCSQCASGDFCSSCPPNNIWLTEGGSSSCGEQRPLCQSLANAVHTTPHYAVHTIRPLFA